MTSKLFIIASLVLVFLSASTAVTAFAEVSMRTERLQQENTQLRDLVETQCTSSHIRLLIQCYDENALLRAVKR